MPVLHLPPKTLTFALRYKTHLTEKTKAVEDPCQIIMNYVCVQLTHSCLNQFSIDGNRQILHLK